MSNSVRRCDFCCILATCCSRRGKAEKGLRASVHVVDEDEHGDIGAGDGAEIGKFFSRETESFSSASAALDGASDFIAAPEFSRRCSFSQHLDRIQ
jgi:hypothetical protein